MNWNKLICCTTFFVVGTSFAQVSFTGMVIDPGGAPIPGANVVLGNDPGFGGYTDVAGRFLIRGVHAGPQRVRISCISYQPLDTLFVVGASDGEHTFALPPQAVAMRAAEVTALRVGDRAPFAKTLLTREAIQQINVGVDLPFLLEQQPSVVATSDAGTGVGYTYMRIRGTDGTRTNITVNGVPFNDAESQGSFLVNMPDLATSAEDIEVQRGVGTSTNGPAAFGASVNIRTTAVKREPWALLAASGGSFNTQRYSVSAGTGLIQDRFSFDVRLSSITSDGYIDRASAALKSYFLQGAWIGKKRALRLITFRGQETTYQAWGGVPRELIATDRTYNGYTYDNEVDNYDQTHYQLLFDQRLGAHATFNATLYHVAGAGYFEQFRQADDLSTYGIPSAVINGDTIATTDLVRRRWLENTLTGANINTDITLGAHRLVIGASLNEYQGAHFGEVIWARYAGSSNIRDRYYDDDATKRDASAFAKLTYAVSSRLDLYGDLQVRHVRHSLQGLTADLENVRQRVEFNFFNPKAGLLWKVGERGKAYASVAVANREPNREDLLQTTPTSRPKSERLLDYEGGYEHRTGRINAGVNLYYMDYIDQLVLTGELNDVGAALRTNVESSYRAGVECMIAMQLTKRLIWRGNATFSQNKVRSFTEFVDAYDAEGNWAGQQIERYANADLAFSPSVIGGSEVGFVVVDRPGKTRAEATLVTKYVGEQYLDNTSSKDRMLDDYLVNDLRINLSLLGLKGAKSIDFNLTIRNLFSTLYESNGWVYSYVVGDLRQQDVGLFPQAPINVLCGLNLRF